MAKRVVLYDTVTGKYEPIVGTDNQALTWDSAAAGGLGAWVSAPVPYDVASMVVGKTLASPSNVVMYLTATRAFTISTDTAKHYFKAVTAATSSTAFTVKRGANTVFTATFAPAGTTASIGAIDTNYNAFSAGDVLTVEGPAIPDATLADIYWTINAAVA